MVGRSIPGLMAPTSIVAGTLKMPAGQFLKGVVFLLSLWMLAFITLGGISGHFMTRIDLSPGRLLIPLLVLIAFGVLIGVPYLCKRIKRSRKGQKILLEKDKEK